MKRKIGKAIWSLEECFHISLGKFAPVIFGWMIGAEKGRKLTDREIREWHMGITPKKHCPFCGKYECKDETIEIVDDHEAVTTKVIRCGYCGVIFIMDGEDFNKRKKEAE